MAPSTRPDNSGGNGEHRCTNCDSPLVQKGNIWLCRSCNAEDFSAAIPFDQDPSSDVYVFIDCPGATLYEPGTQTVTAGVRWFDDTHPERGFEIVKHEVYAPNHTNKRRIKREALGKIRRCQACQDYTIRMRRREGPDFFIPSSKHPGRKKLKSVDYSTRAQR
jgi:ribosomal protein L37AE/L43A